MQNINEELKRMLYLTQHMRGVVISEQNNPGQLSGVQNRPKSDSKNTKAPDWKGMSSGTIDVTRFSIDAVGIPVNATNVNYNGENYNLSISKNIGKNLPYTITKSTPPTNEPDTRKKFEFADKSYPYDDNMITPQITKNANAESLFYYIRDIIVKNIKKGGLESMKSIIIQGFADSARPGTRGPKGTRQEVEDDHKKAGCSKIYCGEKDDAKRNLWLAENRAKRMGAFLTNMVKQETNTDISSLIKYLEPVSSFDPSISFEEGKRAGKRSVSVEINKSDDIVTPGVSTPGKVETINVVPTPKKGTIQYGNVVLNLLELIDSSGYSKITVEKTDDAAKLIGNKIPDLSESGKLNGKTSVSCEIKNNQVFVDNISWGEFTEDRGGAYAKIRYVSVPGVLCLVGDYDNKLELSVYSVILSDIQI
jgi:hypothetical protein